jgi:hypothetical protein
VRILLALLVLFAPAPASADDSATARHLLAGVRAFKDGRYEDALVELRVVQRASDAPDDLAFYLGPTLYKLQRYGDALAVFITSRAPFDALTEFYLGETYYQLRLYRKARAVFAGLRQRGLGPALDEAAARYVAAVDNAYRTPPTTTPVDYYLAEGSELAGKEPLVAAEYFDEARQVETLAAQRYRRAEILARLAAAWNAGKRPRAVIEQLANEPITDDLAWELARAYVATNEPAKARALLDPIARGNGPHATEAGGILAKLPP